MASGGGQKSGGSGGGSDGGGGGGRWVYSTAAFFHRLLGPYAAGLPDNDEE